MSQDVGRSKRSGSVTQERATTFEQAASSFAHFCRPANARLIERLAAKAQSARKAHIKEGLMFFVLMASPLFALYGISQTVDESGTSKDANGGLYISLLSALMILSTEIKYLEYNNRKNVYYQLLTKGIILDFDNTGWWYDRTFIFNVVCILGTLFVMWKRITVSVIIGYTGSIIFSAKLLFDVLHLEDRVLSLNNFVEICDVDISAIGEAGFRFVHESNFVEFMEPYRIALKKERQAAKVEKRKAVMIRINWDEMHKLSNHKSPNAASCSSLTNYLWGVSLKFLMQNRPTPTAHNITCSSCSHEFFFYQYTPKQPACPRCNATQPVNAQQAQVPAAAVHM